MGATDVAMLMHLCNTALPLTCYITWCDSNVTTASVAAPSLCLKLLGVWL